ncbi:DEAD/DEAH box helicase [Flavobacterium agrisoli]|uniref:DEAD/DEAH box helicase n=1 Tax=Flavobacterium agrisoli TaxID=2793066 RepID=A0A934PI34_9FLAO|nr:DEAD/DEAH box helicase [Flavobacterium agrisoli]MBK0368516.1 DEAD/DEAH box helicase [Flavobacterium agrisoli]
MSVAFKKLGISASLLQSLNELDIVSPTEIQQQAIPLLLKNETDVVALAKTGTGKTAAFGLPLLQLINTNENHVQAVILAPTRELGQQIFSNLTAFSKYLPEVNSISLCGGTSIKPQIQELKQATHIVVATPGRLIDLIQRKAIDLSKTSFLVLDEADEMIAILKESIDEIIAEMPKKRRTFLFSATLSGAIKQLVQNYLLKNVVTISADMETVGNQQIEHQYIVVEAIEKLDVLMHFLNSREGEKAIIFCKTKAAVNKLAKNLAINRFSSGALHGSLTQGIRDRIMGQFRENHISILVATDLASRGIDVSDVSFVINYHLPDTYENYVHRSGRTARAGATGLSLTILQPEEEVEIADFEKELGLHFTKIEKPSGNSIEANNTILWAKKIFKTKPNHEIEIAVKQKVKSIFHHLTKEELIEKLLAQQYLQMKPEPAEKPVKKNKK